MQEFTLEEAARHDELCSQAQALTEGELQLGGLPLKGKPGWWTRKKLQKAIGYYEQALIINPESWQIRWSLGKIYQRLQQQETAFEYFKKAHQMNPEWPDVAREAGLAALDLGLAEEAVALCQTALALSPEDSGLVPNLALAYLIADNIPQATETINRAVEANPQDGISKNVQRFIAEVAAGTKPRPKNLQELKG